jgi:hypothetical protein
MRGSQLIINDLRKLVLVARRAVIRFSDFTPASMRANADNAEHFALSQNERSSQPIARLTGDLGNARRRQNVNI